MKRKTRFDVDTLFNALYEKDKRPNSLKDSSENQIIREIIVLLRSSELTKESKRSVFRRLSEVVFSDEFNSLGRRRVLKYLLREKVQKRLDKKIVKKIRKFCKEFRNVDWVKGLL